jgi:hypothetical protein
LQHSRWRICRQWRRVGAVAGAEAGCRD